ncbi:cytochrome P450 [Xylariaceae sp. FL1272]|nr:cytochrome P450 [Xylariaceae sp. FL1272]
MCLPENTKLKAKLLDELGTISSKDPTETELRNLPYLNRVIAETLRLHSAVPGYLRREIPPGGAIIGGCALPAKSEVMTNAYCLRRNERAFRVPEAFDPDRWEHQTQEMRDAYLPFGGGSRGEPQPMFKSALRVLDYHSNDHLVIMTACSLHKNVAELRMNTVAFFK